MDFQELKAARQRAHMTQEAMADAIGVNIRLYQKYEAGDTPIRTVVALAVTHVLHCKPARRPVAAKAGT